MRLIRSLTATAIVYGGCLAATAATPASATAQIVYGSYIAPYATPYGSYGVYPAGVGYYSSYYSPYGTTAYPSGWYNWGGNTTPSGYPQWYVNYARWNRPYSAYYNRGYFGRRW
jgi:hypothetical protein